MKLHFYIWTKIPVKEHIKSNKIYDSFRSRKYKCLYFFEIMHSVILLPTATKSYIDFS